jgi:capsular polysaccharide biosynthesis protein
VKVIDPAADPTVPVSLPGFVFLIAGVFAGVALGSGLAVIAELLDQRLRYPSQFTALTGLPVLVCLPKIAPTSA